jgi:hypothetical protein
LDISTAAIQATGALEQQGAELTASTPILGPTCRLLDGSHRTVDLLWAPAVIAAIFVAMAYSYWSMYIQADDMAVVFRFVVTRRYDRRGGGSHPDWTFRTPWRERGAFPASNRFSSGGSSSILPTTGEHDVHRVGRKGLTCGPFAVHSYLGV